MQIFSRGWNFWAVEKAGRKWYINVDYEKGEHTSYNVYGENPPALIYLIGRRTNMDNIFKR
jgi:hypothetical protein